jgi:hypothetical protein
MQVFLPKGAPNSAPNKQEPPGVVARRLFVWMQVLAASTCA